jgi:hypothetical protein
MRRTRARPRQMTVRTVRRVQPMPTMKIDPGAQVARVSLTHRDTFRGVDTDQAQPQPLLLARPPKKWSEMTDAEKNDWADKLIESNK